MLSRESTHSVMYPVGVELKTIRSPLGDQVGSLYRPGGAREG